MTRTLEERRKATNEASRRWRERHQEHQEQAKKKKLDAYYRRRAELGLPKQKTYGSDEERAEAKREYHKLWRREWLKKGTNRARAAATTHRSYLRHADKRRAEALKWHYDHLERSLDRIRWGHIRRAYGLTKEQYLALGDVCNICGLEQKDSKRKLHVDHDHDTKKVRGKLCGLCNNGIGYFKHDQALLQKAIEYLARHTGNNQEGTEE